MYFKRMIMPRILLDLGLLVGQNKTLMMSSSAPGNGDVHSQLFYGVEKAKQ